MRTPALVHNNKEDDQMTMQIIERNSDRWIVVTDDKRQIFAINNDHNDVHYIDDAARWMDEFINPTRLEGHIFAIVAKAGTDVVRVNELKAELIKATDDRGQDLDRMVLDMIDNYDPDIKVDDDPLHQAIRYATAYLHVMGMINECGRYDTDGVTAYRLDLAGKVAAEVIHGTKQMVTIAY